MKGKREFCPGDKCKNAWKYANRTGKIETKKNGTEIPQNIPENISTLPMIVGQMVRVTTTADQCVRIQVDIPIERVGFDVIKYLNRRIVVAFINDDEENSKKDTDKSDTERFF